MFERFYRSASAQALPGSGLGLVIVKQVVLNHGGLLRIEDTDPGGQPLERRFTCCSRPSDAVPRLPGATAGARARTSKCGVRRTLSQWNLSPRAT